MAGSLTRFKYITDDLDEYAIKCDKSNTTAANGANAIQATVDLVELPSNIKPRYVIYRSDNGKVTRKCYIVDPDVTPSNIPNTYTISQTQTGTTTIEVVLKKAFFSGEKHTFIAPDDTALKDNETATTA